MAQKEPVDLYKDSHMRQTAGGPLLVAACMLAGGGFVACGGQRSPWVEAAGAAADAGWGLFPRLWAGGTDIAMCQEITRPLSYEPRAADVLLLFDRSGSMSAGFGSGTRYSVEAAILKELVTDYDDRIRFGLAQFPSPDEYQPGCAPGCCAAMPSVAVGFGTAAAIGAAIDAADPVGGNTPTAGALRLARLAYQEMPASRADRFVLLATDGRPSCGASGRLAEADSFDSNGHRSAGACYDALVEIAALVRDGVKVIVLGVGPGLDTDPAGRQPCLEEMALLGGAQSPGGAPYFFPATEPEHLEAALQRIFGALIRPSCLLRLETPPPRDGVVAVFIDGHEIPRHRGQGWDFEAPEQTREIRIFGEYCRRLEKLQVSEVAVRYGCPICTSEIACIDPVDDAAAIP